MIYFYLLTITLKNCSETALEIVREKIVSAEAQTPTNEAEITVLLPTLKHVNMKYTISMLNSNSFTKVLWLDKNCH